MLSEGGIFHLITISVSILELLLSEYRHIFPQMRKRPEHESGHSLQFNTQVL
jgi:hypothetical protein